MYKGEKKFRRAHGCKSMPVLINALALDYQRKQNKLESNRKVA